MILRKKDSRAGWLSCTAAVLVSFAIAPSTVAADIIWNGDFSNGDLTQYHVVTGPGSVKFFSVPEYGRPIQYGDQNPDHVGNGELLSLVSSSARTVNGVSYPQGPTRGSSQYAAKFTVKNSINGAEPADCDPTPGNCARRRAQLKMQTTHPAYYGALQHMEESWVSFSFFVPSDWSNSGSGFGPIIMGIKMADDSYNNTGWFGIDIENNAWKILHRWSDSLRPGTLPWQQSMFYQGNYDGQPYPRSDSWPDGLVDFPDIAASQAALTSVNTGGWTDWVLHFRQDHRGSDQGGTGFLDVWKREDSGPWIRVLAITPHETTRGGMTFNYGIGFNLAASSSTGSGTVVGLYMDKNRVWNDSNDRVIYVANHKIGDSNTVFSSMSPDGSSPNAGPAPAATRPKPPVIGAGKN